jgi:hypothetical protein
MSRKVAWADGTVALSESHTNFGGRSATCLIARDSPDDSESILDLGILVIWLALRK